MCGLCNSGSSKDYIAWTHRVAYWAHLRLRCVSCQIPVVDLGIKLKGHYGMTSFWVPVLHNYKCNYYVILRFKLGVWLGTKTGELIDNLISAIIFSLMCPVSLEQPPAVCPFSQFSCYLQEISEDRSLWFGLSPIDTITLHGLLMLRNCFPDFAVKHWFGCRTTESGFAGDIGAIEVWLVDWLILFKWQLFKGGRAQIPKEIYKKYSITSLKKSMKLTTKQPEHLLITSLFITISY